MPPPDKQKRPAGRPRPVRGTAKSKVTASPSLMDVAERAVEKAGDRTQKTRPAPALGIRRLPKTRASLYARYGLVFDPAGENSPVTQNELDSLMELYRRSTGQELDTKSDVRKALESVGLIGGPLAPGSARRKLEKEFPSEFASATDALDWLDSQAGKFTGRATSIKQAPLYAAYGLTPAAVGLGMIPGVDEAVKKVGRGVADISRLQAAPSLFALRQTAQLPSARPRFHSRAGLTPSMGGPTVGEDVSTAASALKRAALRAAKEGLRGTAAGLRFAGRFAAPATSPLIWLTPYSASRGEPLQPSPTFGENIEWALDTSENPNQYVQVGTDAVLQRIPEESENREAIEIAGDAAFKGLPTALVQSIYQQSQGSPFSPDEDAGMRFESIQNGWPVEDWDRLEAGEKIYRAFNKNDYTSLFFRSLLRGVAETAAVPVAAVEIVAAASEAAGGDTQRGEEMLQEVFAPYAFAGRQASREGATPAIMEFIRDNPIEAIFIMNMGIRTASRAAGTAARAGAMGSRLSEAAQSGRIVTVPGDEVRIAARPVPKPEGLSIVELGARQRIIDENRRRAAAGEMYVERPEVPIGVTGRGLLGTLVWTRGLKKYLATKSNWFRGKLEYVPAKREVRLMGNVRQGEIIEIERIFNSALGRVPEAVRQRAAFNLVYPAVDSRGRRVTPAYVAEFYEGSARRLRDDIEAKNRQPNATERAQLELWDNGAAYMRILDEVEVDPYSMGRLREEARRYGRMNDEIVAEAMAMSVRDVKRANYIRMTLLDPDLEVSARRLKSERSVGVGDLVRAQNRARSAARRFERSFSQTGWGRKGPAGSRRAFNRARAELVLALRQAEAAARAAGRADLADGFRADRQALAASRMESRVARERAADRVRELAAGIEARRLSDAEIEELPAAAREAYLRAREAGETEARIGAERAAALEEAGVRRVTERTTRQAQERSARTEGELAALEDLPSPPVERVSSLRERLRGEREAARARERALETQRRTDEPLETAARTRREQVAIAKRELKRGRPVFEDPETQVVIDATKRYATVRKAKKRDFNYYTIKRARNEVLDEYIARLEMLDQNPVLHLIQTPDFKKLGKPSVIEGDRILDLTARGGMVRGGRFVESDGFLFATAQESGRMWQNLIADTAELIAAAGWRAKMQQLIDAIGIPFAFGDDAIAAAARIIEADPVLKKLAKEDPNLAQRIALERVIRTLGAEYDANDFVVINPRAPSAKKPSARVSYGVSRALDAEAKKTHKKQKGEKDRESNDWRDSDLMGRLIPSRGSDDSLGALVMRQIDERTIDPNSPGTYYLIPRKAYEGIQKAIANEAFKLRPGRFGYRADIVSRAWRTLTLNVLPRTAINNVVGSTILAIQGGAGPRAMYYAASAIFGKEVRLAGGKKGRLPVPPELRQRYYEQLTDPVGTGFRRGALKEPTMAQAAMSGLAWWMNSMRFFNGFAEDFGRLAVWYHHAYPTAMKAADGKRVFRSAQSLTDDAVDMLESMARGDADWAVKHRAWVDKSFDFLGDLHRGGPVYSRLRIAIPFWQWYMHMLKLTFFTMPVKYPGRALFMQQLAEIGSRYQQKHGMFVPYGEDIIPWYTLEETLDDGTKQEFVRGFGTGTWYPQGTTAPIGSKDGESGALRFVQSAVVPWMTNSALILGSIGTVVAGGEAKDISDREIIKAAKDEYGLPIDQFDQQFARYVGNKLFNMAPLSPTVMSMSGRASTALPLPGQMKPRAYKDAQMPEALRVRQRGDIASLVDDPSKSAVNFLLKAFAVPTAYIPKGGPLERRRLMREFEYQRREKSRQDRAMAKALAQIHKINMGRDFEIGGSESRQIPRLPE